MELILKRKYYKPAYIIGKLYCREERVQSKEEREVTQDGNHKSQTSTLKSQFYLCDTLEPRSGHLTGNMSAEQVKKIKKKEGIIAISPGRYPVVITKSAKFGKWLPLLVSVPGSSGIRIHAGNTAKDTQGCILPGENRAKGMVLNSTFHLKKIIALLQEAYNKGESVYIRVKA